MNRFAWSLLSLAGTLALAGGVFAATEPAAEPKANPPAVQADAGITVDQLLDNMETVRQTLKTFTADVVKLRRVEVLDSTEKFAGTLQFKTPRLLRLDLTSDENKKQIIYIIGPVYGWIYRVTEKQADRAKLADLKEEKKSGNPLEYGLARDIHGLREGFKLKLLPAEKVGDFDTIPLELTPEGGTDYANGRVIFWIDRATWFPVQVQEYKSNDEIIETHTFSNVRVNVPVADKLFEFDPPKDVDLNLVNNPQDLKR